MWAPRLLICNSQSAPDPSAISRVLWGLLQIARRIQLVCEQV